MTAVAALPPAELDGLVLPQPDLDGTKVEQLTAPAPLGQVVEQHPDEDGTAGPGGELPGGADVFGVLFEMVTAVLAAELTADRAAGRRRPKCITTVARRLYDLGARGSRCVVRVERLAEQLGHEVGRYDGHSQTTLWATIRWLRQHGFLARTRRAFTAEDQYRQLANGYSLRVPRSGPARVIFDRWLPARRSKASHRQRTAAEQAAIDRAMAPPTADETPAPGDGADDGECVACSWTGRPTFGPDRCCRSCGYSQPEPEPVATAPP